MTLEEGIIHAEDVARMNHEAAKHLTDEHPTQAEKCEACAKEHEQLAEWLKDYKRLLEQEPKLRQALELEKGAYNALVKNIQCADCISRAIAQEEITKSIELKENPYQLWDRIQALPSVTPQQRMGRWIKQNYGWNWQCSECGFVTPPSAKEIFTFCPNCGAKMEVEE